MIDPTPEDMDQRIRQMIVTAMLSDETVLGTVTIDSAGGSSRFVAVSLSFRTPKVA